MLETLKLTIYNQDHNDYEKQYFQRNKKQVFILLRQQAWVYDVGDRYFIDL